MRWVRTNDCLSWSQMTLKTMQPALYCLHPMGTLTGCTDKATLAAGRLSDVQGTEFKFAMKTLDKQEMQERNKVQRVLTESLILSKVDHPFLPTVYCTLQTDTHLHFVMEFCDGGELYALLNSQPKKRLKEAHVRFYTAEVLLALQYLHLLGFVYRDLKPENILLQGSGHVLVTDFDLSYSKGQTTARVEKVMTSRVSDGCKARCEGQRSQQSRRCCWQ